MNDLLLLSMLLNGPKHGYRLKREAGLMSGQGNLHNNLVYPMLRRFVAEGLVTQKTAQGERGQIRKVYALTALGKRTLMERLSEYTEEDALQLEPFLLRVGLFSALEPEVRERILSTREEALLNQDKRLEALQQGMDLGRYGGVIVGHLREGFATEIAWVNKLRQLQKKEKGKRKKKMKRLHVAISLLILVPGFPAIAQQAPASSSMMGMQHHNHSGGAPLSYSELKDVVAGLDRARQATAKYQDVHVATAEGYRAIGPDVPGMGVHFVLAAEQDAFDIEKPPILVYEKSPSATGGYSLVGVSYLLKAAEGPDGQPLNAPFPKSLAVWHRHENICVLPDNSSPVGLTEEQCRAKGGRFTAETPWMVHAWIWKDSPLGVFSATNPSVIK
jgi:DNA-binding PadR family transcriptional regulator